jgi:hypothetical protein
VVVFDEQSAAEHPPPMFPPEVLVNLERQEPALILPGPDGGVAAQAFVRGVGNRRAAVGPAVAPRDVLTSLRWARQALLLAQRGLLHSGPIVWCHRHLGTLVLFRDEHLLTELARLRLAPLDHVRASQRSALAETLLAWLKLDRNANDVAARCTCTRRRCATACVRCSSSSATSWATRSPASSSRSPSAPAPSSPPPPGPR